MDLDALKAKALAFRDARDWKQFHTPKNLAMGLSVEAGELLELFLFKTDAEIDAMRDDERIRDEIADVQIYLLFLCEALGVSLDTAIEKKLEKNALKYPVEKSRGTAKKYDEL